MATSDIDEKRDQAYAFLDSGNISQAKILFQQLSELNGGDYEDWMMLGAINGEQNSVQEAVRCLSESIRLNKDNPDAHFMMANMQHAQGNTKDAVLSCETAVQLDTDYLDCWVLLSGLYGILKRFKDVETSCKRVIELDPKSVSAHANLSTAFASQGAIEDALESLQKALSIDPADQGLRTQLGFLWLKNGYPDLARQLFETVLRQLPNNVQATLGIGSVFTESGGYQEAIKSYQKVLDKLPDQVEAHLGLSNIYLASNSPTESINHARLVLKQDPENLQAIANETCSLKLQGNLNAAYERLYPSIENHRDSLLIAKTFAQICQYKNECGKAIDWLDEFISNGKQPRHIARQLHFTLGIMNNDIGEHEASYSSFEQGNKLTTAAFNKEKFAGSIDKLISVYSEDNLQRLPRTTIMSRCPIFLVGMPSSGISHIAEIIATHPDVFNAGRMPDIGDLISGLPRLLQTEISYPECVRDISQAQLNDLCGQYLSKLDKVNSKASRTIDCALVNYLHLGILEMLFPQAIVIHCHKEPLNACISCYTSNIGEQAGFTSKLENIASYYNQYQRLMRHWKSVLSIPILDVSHEKLSQDAALTSQEIIEFCKLESDNTISTNMASRAQEIESSVRPIDPKNFPDYLGILKTMVDT